MRGMGDPSAVSATAEARQAKYHPLVIVLVAVCAGILADHRWGWPLATCWTVSAAAWAGWLVLWRRGWSKASCLALLVSVAGLAAAWHHCRWYLFAEGDLGAFARMTAQPACIEAIALRTPEPLRAPPPDPMRGGWQGDRTRVELAAVAIRDGSRWRPIAGQTRLTVEGHLLGVHVRDRLRVFAQLAALSPPDNPGQFDVAAYERIDRRRCRLWAESPDCVTVIRPAGRWAPARWLETIRLGADRFLREYLAPESYGLATALLLGIREELGGEGIDPYMETGTIHILSISGLHVGIIAGTILWLVRRLASSRRRALWTVAGVTTLYTLLTGAQPPAVRALVLVLLVSWANYLYRPSLPLNSLAAAALVVLAINPAHLFSIGVQLSFLGVVGVVYVAPQWFGATERNASLERLIQESRGWGAWALRNTWRNLRDVTVASAVIWSLTLPLVMARFHLFNPVAVALTTLLWPLVPVAMISGFGVIGLGWLCPPLAWALRWLCDGSLWLIDELVRKGRDMPGSHAWVPGPSEWWLWGFYGGLAVLAFPPLRPPRRWCLALLALWSGIGFSRHLLPASRERLEATILSVGHGLAVVLCLPDGATMLYDAGDLTFPGGSAQTIAACLWEKGITHVDAVVLSHGDADHYNALPGLLERFSVGAIYVSPVMFVAVDEPGLRALHEAIARSRVPLREIAAGDRLRAGADCLLEVLHPPRRGVLGSDNANSIVLAVEYLGRRLLLPADLDSPGMEDVTAEEPWTCDVLLAPHHGSWQSNQARLAAWSRPRWVVVSGDRRVAPQTALDAYRALGSRVLHTGTDGAVRVEIGPGDFTIMNKQGAVWSYVPMQGGQFR